MLRRSNVRVSDYICFTFPDNVGFEQTLFFALFIACPSIECALFAISLKNYVLKNTKRTQCRMRCVKALQLTLAVIKPDAVAHPLILEALHQKIQENFIIIKKKDLLWTTEDSERFYAEHSGRFFYQRLVEFMSSGPMRAYILAREDAVSEWRRMMGPTKVFRARFSAPNSLRGQYGLTDTRNTTHGSDSIESARREISFFFPEFQVDDWMKEEELRLRSGFEEHNK